MSKLEPTIEWLTVTGSLWDQYGITCLAGKWAVVKSVSPLAGDFEVITEWVDDRKTAIGFVKLLME